VPRSTQVTWPSFSLQPTMRLVFDPPLAGPTDELRDTGPWALFRLFGRGRLQAQPGTTDRYRLTFQLGGRQAVFDVRVQASTNPFAPALLQDFRCPSVRPG
jgi:type VI secretion system protein ImpL